MNDLVAQIAKVEIDRTVMLAIRPETSPQAVALNQARDSLMGQLMPIAMSYRQSLARQRASIERDLKGLYAQIARLPGQTAAVAKEQADFIEFAAQFLS